MANEKREVELVAEAVVRGLYADLVNPGGGAGPKFSPATFNVGRHVRAMLPMHFAKTPSEVNMQHGVEFATKLWKSLNGLS